MAGNARIEIGPKDCPHGPRRSRIARAAGNFGIGERSAAGDPCDNRKDACSECGERPFHGQSIAYGDHMKKRGASRPAFRNFIW